MKQEIVILAAGKGSRMKSNLSKVMHPLGGVPMISRVLNTANEIPHTGIHLVVGHQGQQVAEHCQNEAKELNIVWQHNPKGTGDALRRVAPHLSKEGATLTLYGDVPLIKPATLRAMAEQTTPNTLVLLTVYLENPTGYGRIVRDENDRIVSIVEEKDATPTQRLIKEVNTGVMLAPNLHLHNWLERLTCNNAQGEYYLTDIVAMAAEQKLTIKAVQPEYEFEVSGVNDRVQLAKLERILQENQATELMESGVSLIDPNRFDLRGNLISGQDVHIDIDCIFEGEVSLGNNVHVGPYCHLKNCTIGDNCRIESHTVIESSQLDSNCSVGPFARLRPGTELAKGVKVGNFVEVKKSSVGSGSKINHLSYVGDTQMGSDVNVGAGTITCNYDGANKHLTEIGDGVFIGSNSALVAPVKLGSCSTIAAGSIITKEVKNNQLAIARGRQVQLDNWSRPKKKS